MGSVVFTAHNIRLDDGEYTKPEIGYEMSQHPWFISARRVLSLAFPGDKTRYTVLDLGCLEGGYTVEFARMGFRALGIEVRESNFAACRYVKERVDLPGLSFACDDAWNAKKYGPVDAVFCCGLLYHLERPRAFLKMLSGITRRVLIVQTHFATGNVSNRILLSEMTESEGAEGQWYTEYPKLPDVTAREQNRWSAWGNAKSFWMTRPWILQSLYDAGFDVVFEQFDSLIPSIAAAMTRGQYRADDRGTFVGVKTEGL